MWCGLCGRPCFEPSRHFCTRQGCAGGHAAPEGSTEVAAGYAYVGHVLAGDCFGESVRISGIARLVAGELDHEGGYLDCGQASLEVRAAG